MVGSGSSSTLESEARDLTARDPDFTAFDGSVGYVELTLQGPDTLVGTFVNTTHSTTSPAYLTRTG